MKSLDLKEIFEEGHEENIKAYLNFLDNLEIVDLFYLVNDDYYKVIIDKLDDETLAEILPFFEKSLAEKVIELIDPDRRIVIFDLIETDDAAYLLRSLEEEEKDIILPKLSKRIQIERIMSYPEGCAGSIMQSEVCILKEEMSVKESIDAIKLQKRKLGEILSAYVVNDEKKLIGIVHLDDLIVSKFSDSLTKIIEPLKHYIYPEEDQEEAAHVFSKQDLSYLPVIDKEGVLLGQITFDDIQDVIESEASEDILAFAGVSPEESLADIDQNKLKMAWGRFPWLIFSISASMLTGYILTFFEKQTENAIIFASFVPLIMSTTGNVGTQTAMIVTRNFALGANEFGDFRLPLMREFLVGSLVGLMASISTFLITFLFYGQIGISFRVSVTIIISVMTASLFGMFIPIGFKKIGVDPAIAAGPLVTSGCDMISVSLYLGIIISMNQLLHF